MECGVFYMLDWRFTAMCYDITYLMHVLLCHIKYQLLVDWISTTGILNLNSEIGKQPYFC